MGPWRGEVGFESLYWLPFLDWFREAYQIDPDRLIPISRGGASALYRTPMGLELYALRDPQDVRVANRLLHKRTAMLKQRDPSDEWDAAVIRDAASASRATCPASFNGGVVRIRASSPLSS